MMSLKDVILEIAEEMEEEAKVFIKANADFAPVIVKGWAKQLRQAVKASKGDDIVTAENMVTAFMNQPIPRVNVHKPPVRDSLESPDDMMGGGRMVLCIGGENDGVCAPLDNRAPMGCKTLVGGEVYILLIDDRLHFSAAETLKLQEECKGK